MSSPLGKKPTPADAAVEAAVRRPAPRPGLRWLQPIFLALSIISLPAISLADAPAGSQRSTDPLALVRRASRNELASGNTNTQAVRYKLRKVDQKGITTKEIVESKDGGVARLIAIDDKPLTPEQEQRETDRLNNLLTHPELQEHRRKREKEDESRVREMVRLLPDAFLYQSAGTVQAPGGQAYRLTFQPNPDFHPPDREAEVYHGMVGELWIDKRQERMVKIDAHLIADVDFGWGILGRLYKGGSIVVEQADVGHHHWEATHMKLNLTGKLLMLKALNLATTEDSSDFQPVPRDISYQEAVHMLEGSAPHPASNGN